MKKHLALVLALVMVLTSFSFVSAAPDFSDMEGHVNAEAVARLELLNVLKGYPDGTFKPDDTITRAEFAAVAVRVSGLENVAMAAKGLPTGFSDVPAWHWASGYVGTAAKTGIVVGIGNGLFAPESPVKYEEAITMIVRALGYEPMAQARGGYPFGYLIVANEIDLLDGAMGTQGTWATRGFVAQITDNALEIPMMVQVGFGSDAKWVVSGSSEHGGDEEYLLDRMGFETVKGRITEVDIDDLEIYINADDRDDRGWYDVAATFDFYAVEGVEVKAWLDGDMVILAAAQEDVAFDAVEVVGDEITLVEEDKDYDLADDAMLFVDGVEKEFVDAKYDYAKVVFNDDGDVVWVDAIEVLEFIVVEEVDDEMVLDLNDDELDVEDYLIVMGGKTISVDDLEKGDVLFFLADDYKDYDGFAVVYNNSIVGEVTRVYTAVNSVTVTSFRIDGSTYDVSDMGAVYIDGNTLDTLTADVLDKMMDEGNEVEVFFDFNGDVVLVVGETGEGDTSTFYAVLIDDAVAYDGRRGEMLALDMFNEFGEKVSFDITEKFINDGDFDQNDVINVTTGAGIIVTEEFETKLKINGDTPFLFEVEVDEDGSLETLKLLPVAALATNGFEIDDTYAKVGSRDYRLMSTTVVFFDYSDGEFEDVIALGDIDDEFAAVEDGFAFVEEGRAKVVLATKTDADTDATDYTGYVTRTRVLRSGEMEVTIRVAGTEYVFVTAESATDYDVTPERYSFYTLSVGDTSGEIDKIAKVDVEEFTVSSVDATARKLTLKNTSGGAIVPVELTSDAVIYEEGTTDTMRLRDVKKDQVVNVVFDELSEYWVSYMTVKVAGTSTTTPVADTYTVTAVGEVDGNIIVTLDTTSFVYAGSLTFTEVKDLKNTDVEATFGEVRGEVVILTIE